MSGRIKYVPAFLAMFCVFSVGVSAFGDWSEGDPYKMHWPQLPDPTPNGFDVKATMPFILADDFRCIADGPITGIHVWASWYYDNKDVSPTFTLSLHADVPAGGPQTYSMPGATLWTNTFEPGTYTERTYFGGPEGWLDPDTTNYVPYADEYCYQYNFAIPPEMAFNQTSGTVYWLDVQVKASEGKRMGWKIARPDLRWNDDAVWTIGAEPNPQGTWYPLKYPPTHPLEGQSLDLAFVIDGGTPVEPPPPPPETPDLKWLREPDTANGVDVESHELAGGGQAIFRADDFISDGRPITGIRWWGSYIGHAADMSDPVSPPAGERPTGFRVRWYADIPAGGVTNYSVPRVPRLKEAFYQLADFGVSNAPVIEQYCTNVFHSWNQTNEHEYVYDLIFTNNDAWLEKEGTVYWLCITAVYAQDTPSSNRWGWATVAPDHNWNDAAVHWMGLPPVNWKPLTYADLDPAHPYGSSTPVNLAFGLYTDVHGRRTKKWVQPPDMVLGQNMPSFVVGNEAPGLWPLRADDFLCDGRRITDIHWWGSYLSYAEDYSGPTNPPVGIASPLGFYLSWHDDVAAGSGIPALEWSRPGAVITNMFVPLADCHEVYYGAVPQPWFGPGVFEHEYQYYVDLDNTKYGPWNETSGTVYWLNIQALFANGGVGQVHQGWGWKTTPVERRWNDASVVSSNGIEGDWFPQKYVPPHPNEGQTFDLAFELTTDQVGSGTNWWYQPIVITNISLAPTNFAEKVMESVGDVGAGVQVLQYSTNLLVTNWFDKATNVLPLPAPWTNTWIDVPAESATSRYYRVIQR